MAELRKRLSAHASVALLVCLCYLLSSTGYLSWLQNLRVLLEPTWVEVLSLVFAYLAQAIGVAVFMLVARTTDKNRMRRLALTALVLHLATLVPAIVTDAMVVVVVFGLITNVLYGVIQGYYLLELCTLVGRTRRGTVFGCAYGVSTLLTWLLSLVGEGLLTTGLPSIVCCAVMSAIVFALIEDTRQPLGQSVAPGQDTRDSAIGKDTFIIVCAAIVLACLVKNACFAFPSTDLDSGISLELTRVLYGVGLVLIGIVSDRNRRLGLAACAISLVMPFCMLALSGAGTPATVLWLLGYLLTSIYVLFSVLLAADYAEDVRRPHLACLGMLFKHVGLALGTALSLALADKPVVLIGVTAVLLIATAAIFIVLDQRMFAKQPPAESPEIQERKLFEHFSSTYGLSARERDVLRLLLAEKTNSEIAGELVLSERTVKFHMSNLLKKTGCKTRLEVLAKYAELG